MLLEVCCIRSVSIVNLVVSDQGYGFGQLLKSCSMKVAARILSRFVSLLGLILDSDFFVDEGRENGLCSFRMRPFRYRCGMVIWWMVFETLMHVARVSMSSRRYRMIREMTSLGRTGRLGEGWNDPSELSSGGPVYVVSHRTVSLDISHVSMHLYRGCAISDVPGDLASWR